MARTKRNLADHLWRKPLVIQQERRQYFAAMDQEEKVHVRPKRNLRHLPHDRREIRVAGDWELLSILDSWLKTRVGQPWSEVYRELGKFPLAKTTVRTRQGFRRLGKSRVITDIFLKCNKPWFINGDLGERPLSKGFYVHPVTGILCLKAN